ncbi:MAG: RNA ligase family protein [Eubacterium sp.]|nr:RNA ligase family protein [Eubacterium sp.]
MVKRYLDIDRMKDKYALAFSKGEHITITEKCDGANASIGFEDGELSCFSRKQKLSPENTLRGFYTLVQTFDVEKYREVLGDRYIVFGEWLVSHTIKYPATRLSKFYVFDVWDTEVEQYVPWSVTKDFAAKLGLTTVPLFYDGPFVSWEHVQSFVGKTEMDAEPTGEGVVIKSQDRLDNKSSNTPPYVKIVAAKFSEVHQSKPHEVDPEKLAAKQAAEALATTIVTERRVQKLLEKAVDEGRLRADWDEKDLGTIAKFLCKDVYADCVKEEPETVAQIENFGKIAAGIAMKLARGLVK